MGIMPQRVVKRPPTHPWSVPRVWEGETVFVIGGGPSVEGQRHLFHKLQERRCIGVNNSYQHGSWVGVIFFGDAKWWIWHREAMVKYPGLIVTNCPADIFPPKVVKRTLRQHNGWSVRQDTIAWNANSGYSAINLAALFGASRIVLLGFDMSPDAATGKYHWHAEHPVSAKMADYHNFLGFTRHIKRGAEQQGVQIINTSLNSKITEFEKIALEDILKEY